MSLYSKLRTVVRDPKKVILYLVLGRPYFQRVMTELGSIRQCLEIKPETPLERHALNSTDINEHLVTLYMLTKQMRLLNVLELGVRTGESTISFLSAARENGGMVTSIDIVDCPDARSKIDSLGLSKWWRFIKGDDLEVGWNEVIDHLFIDTSHTYDHTLRELQKFEPWVSAGGIITLHDIVAFPDVLRAVNDYLRGRKDLHLYKYFHNNGLAVIFKATKR